MNQELDSEVIKLLDYAKNKKSVTWDEITELLTQDYVNSPKMEGVLQLLEQNNIQVISEIDPELVDDDEDDVQEVDDEDLPEDDDAEIVEDIKK